jgi:long-chain fatty acid transport protein
MVERARWPTRPSPTRTRTWPAPPRMRWVLAALATAPFLAAGDGRAAGFQVNEQNARGLGSAFAGEAASAEDAGTIFFNPAGLTLLKGTQFVTGGFAIKPTANFHNNGSTTNPTVIGGGPLKGGNDGNGTPMALVDTFFASHELLADRLWIGFGASTPYGLKTSWNPSWVGRYHAIDTELITINTNPSLAVKLSDWFSFGAGADVEYARARLTNALDLGSLCQVVGRQQGIRAPVCLRVLGLKPQGTDGFVVFRGDDFNASYNVGFLFTPSDTTRIGLAYRAYTHHSLGGQASFGLPKRGEALRKLSGALFDTGGHAAVDLPDRVSLSAFHQLTARWAFLADITWTHWSQFKDLIFYFDNPKQPTLVAPQRWNDSFRYSLGLRWDPFRQWSFRLGGAYDETPVPSQELRTARIPDSDRIWATFGAGFRWTDRVRFDFGYAHLFSIRASSDNPDPISHDLLKGHYTAHADIVGLGLTYTPRWPLWPPWGKPL